MAVQAYRGWQSDWQTLAEKIARSRTSWLMPGIVEGLDVIPTCPQRPEKISIAATDGSQIFPDRHEISSCFLINIGYILLHYGTGEKPLMSSKPTLYYREEEIFEEWDGRRVFVNRELVGTKRGLMEFSELAALSLAAQERVLQPASHRRIICSTNVAETSLTVDDSRSSGRGGS